MSKGMMSRVAAVLCVVVAALALPTAARGEAGPVSSHAQIHTCCTPAGQVERIFAESKAMGAAYVRVDFELNAIFEAYGAPVPVPDWTRVDHVLALSRRYDLPVLGIVLGTPTWISACAGWRTSNSSGTRVTGSTSSSSATTGSWP